MLLEIRSLRDQLIAIEQQREMLERDLHRAEEALDSERQAVQELTMVFTHYISRKIFKVLELN